MRNSAKIYKAVIEKYQKIPKTWDGILGNGLGVVDVPNRQNYVWVRIENQAPVQIFNKRVAPIYNQPVIVGYDPIEPRLFQVLSVKSIVSPRGMGGIQDRSLTSAHHMTHEWMADNGGNDVVFSQIRQMMPMRPFPAGGMLIDIYRSAPAWFGNAWGRVSGQTVDLSPYIPITGARYNLLYAESTGLVRVATGTVRDLMTLYPTDIPVPPPGTIPIAAIRTYSGQTGVTEARTWNDIADVRWGNGIGAPSWQDYVVAWTCTSGGAPSIADGSITGRYIREPSKKVTAVIVFTAGTGTDYGGGPWRFSLPVVPKTILRETGLSQAIYASGSFSYTGNCMIQTNNLLNATGDGTLGYRSTIPFAWCASSRLHLEIVYEEI